MKTRQLKILNYLLVQDDYVPAQILADKFDVTPKTIYIDINVLRDELKSYNLEIDKRPYRGIKVIGKKQDINKALEKANTLKEIETDNKFDIDIRRRNLFINIIVKGKGVSLQNIAEEYYVSKTAILNDLDYLTKSYLKQFHVSFKTTDKKIIAVGSEFNIQSAAIDYLLNTITFHKVPFVDFFGNDLYDLILEVFNDIISFNNIQITDYYKNAFTVTLLVFIYRNKHGYHIGDEEYINTDGMLFISDYPFVQRIIEYLEEKADIHLTGEDKIILTKYLASYRMTKIDVDKSKYHLLINEIINRLEKTENIVISNRDELEKQLYQHIPAMIMRLKNGVNIVNPILCEIKTRYLPFFTVSWYVLSIIESTFDCILTDDEVSFITIYFQIAINKSAVSHKILVICPYGIASSKYIVNRLRSVLPKYDDIQSCSLSNLKQINMNNVDLIISTTSEYFNSQIPVVKVSPFLDNIDYANIFDVYAKNVFIKTPRLNETIKSNKIKLSTLKKYIKPKYLFFKSALNSKKECMDFMIDILQQNKAVKSGFRESVYKREELGDTVLENSVALPHGDPATVINTSIIIMTLTNPIKWGNNYVDMIVMLAVPNNMESEFNQIVLEIYDLVSNKNIINEIKKIANRADFINSLKE